jgi:hypothetical protein
LTRYTDGKFCYAITEKEAALKEHSFTRIHSTSEALYVELYKQHPILIDDEEVLAELSAFAASLTPILPQ